MAIRRHQLCWQTMFFAKSAVTTTQNNYNNNNHKSGNPTVKKPLAVSSFYLANLAVSQRNTKKKNK